MNKKVKRIIAMSLAISALSMIEPVKYLNLTTTKAYASSTGTKLKKISLGTGSIDFKASKTDYTLQLDSSVDELKVGAVPEDDEATVTINGSEVTEAEGYKRVVSLEKGSNTVIIYVQKKSSKKKYTITVMRGKEKQIYLESISLSAGEINFSKDTTEYNVSVPSSTSDISIKAVPDKDDYDEEINEVTTTDDDNYRRTVKLSNGNNDIDITIKDDDDHEKTYTLHINRGDTNTQTQSSSNNSASTQSTNAASTATAANQQQADKNGTTNAVKGWVSNNNQWSYLDTSGSKITGWKQINGTWYYLGNDGIMKTGWQSVNGVWYYLDSSGAMKIGWIKGSDEKWYYLNNSGAMVKNMTIDGYKLGSDGAMVK